MGADMTFAQVKHYAVAKSHKRTRVSENVVKSRASLFTFLF